MIHKRFMLVAIFLVSLLAISAVSANDLNTTDDVVCEEIAIDDNLEITLDDTISATHTVSGNTFEDIQNVINLANEGDTISLSGLYDGNGNNIRISKKLTIEGNGAILDAHRKSEIFEICGKNVVVNNITFINGYNACGGAIDWWDGIYNDRSNYDGLLTNSRFINCRAELYGGAVYFFSNKLTMKNCYFEGNFAKSGGAVYVAGNFSAIENCTFFNNFYLNTDLDDISVPDGLALLVNLKEDDIFTEYKTDIKDCKYLNDPSAVKYLLSPYSENEEFGDGSYSAPAYKLSGNVVSGNTFADIQKAIDNARPGDVVELSGTYKGNGTPIEIHRGITVVGVGQTTLDADGLSSIFSIQSAGVSIFNLKLINGYSSQKDFLDFQFGGAINSFKNYLYIANTIFENNNGYLVSTLHSVGDYTVLNNCTFRNNQVGITKNTQITLYGYDDCGNSQDGVYTYQSSSIVRLGGKNSVLNNCVYNNNQAYKDFSIKNAQQDEGVVRLSVPSFVKCYGDSKQLELTLTEDGKPISNGKISVQIGHDITKTVYTNSNGKASVDLSGLGLGTYMIVSKYNNLLKVSVVVVELYVPQVEIKTPDVVGYYGGTQKVVTVLTKDNNALSNVNVKISANGKTSTVKTNSKGQASVDLNLPVGTHDVVTEYDNVKVTSKVTVKSTVTASDASGTYLNSKVTATFLGTDGKAFASKQVTFKIGDNTYSATTNSNGVATADIPLGVGSYTVTAVNPTNKEQKQFKLTISKASSSLTLTNGRSNGVVTITAVLTPSSATGNVVFKVNGIQYSKTISNGKAVLTINDESTKEFTVTANYAGDANLNAASQVSKSFSFKDSIIIDDAEGTYLNSKVSATFLDENGNALANTKVTFKVGGKSYAATTNSNGVATINVDLDAGNYTVTASNPVTNKQMNSKLVINKIASSISLESVINDDLIEFTAKLTPSYLTGEVTFTQGKLVLNEQISNGRAVIYLGGFDPGTGSISVEYAGNKNVLPSKSIRFFTVKQTPWLCVDDLTKTYGTSKKLNIEFLNPDVGLANSNVTVLLNGKNTTLKIDSNGKASLPINLAPNKYTATVFYAGDGTFNQAFVTVKILVKKAAPKLTASQKTFKKSVKTKQYTVTLKNNQNKVIKNAKVTLKVNGKTYSVKTNNNGKATFKITNLNKKGTFKATVKYSGNKYYNSKTVNAKIAVK